MRLRPLGDRIVVKQLDADDKTKGGILLPDVSKEKPCMGTVIAVGPGALHESGEFVKMELTVGQVVMYARYGGSDVNLDGKEYTILRITDVIGTVDPKATQ